MTARRPRRSRRQSPAAALPRPTGDTPPASAAVNAARSGRASRQREHHITRDYAYVRHDLLWVLGVSLATLGTIIAAWLFAPTW
ncbi:MAG: hypothetical protein KC479_03130 [Dehalococcoidia bacterium]|nr:hypothetical protein [Dehalococcoidia bacterium]MCA9845157.1 hypothetical protein [Dehalococcoidia bacterium]